MASTALFSRTAAAVNDTKLLDAPKIGRALVSDLANLPFVQSVKLFALAKVGCATVFAANLASVAKKSYLSLKEARASTQEGATTQALVGTVHDLKAAGRNFATYLRIEALNKFKDRDLARVVRLGEKIKDPEMKTAALAPITYYGRTIKQATEDMLATIKASSGKLTADEAKEITQTKDQNSALLAIARRFIKGTARIDAVQDPVVRKELFDAYQAARSSMFKVLCDRRFSSTSLSEDTVKRNQARAAAEHELRSFVIEAVDAFKKVSKALTPSGSDGVEKPVALGILNDRSAALNTRLAKSGISAMSEELAPAAAPQ